MKPLLILAALIAWSPSLLAGESALTTTYQPLDGLGSGTLRICSVTCHDWYGHSGQATAVTLISAPNVPPTNNPKEATEDLNIASVCGVRFSTGDLGDPEAALELTLYMTQFAVSKRFGHPREEILRASLECLRLCLPEKMLSTPLKLKAKDSDKAWLDPIIKAFNAHDRRQVFYTPPE